MDNWINITINRGTQMCAGSASLPQIVIVYCTVFTDARPSMQWLVFRCVNERRWKKYTR